MISATCSLFPMPNFRSHLSSHFLFLKISWCGEWRLWDCVSTTPHSPSVYCIPQPETKLPAIVNQKQEEGILLVRHKDLEAIDNLSQCDALVFSPRLNILLGFDKDDEILIRFRENDFGGRSFSCWHFGSLCGICSKAGVYVYVYVCVFWLLGSLIGCFVELNWIV